MTFKSIIKKLIGERVARRSRLIGLLDTFQGVRYLGPGNFDKNIRVPGHIHSEEERPDRNMQRPGMKILDHADHNHIAEGFFPTRVG